MEGSALTSQFQQNTGINMIISEVRYITGVNKAIQLLSQSIEPAKMEALNETLGSQVNKSILSTALKYRFLTTNSTDKCFSKEDATTIINLFNHASHIPMSDQINLENTCRGIGNIIDSLKMKPKPKRISRVKGDTEKSINEADNRDQ